MRVIRREMTTSVSSAILYLSSIFDGERYKRREITQNDANEDDYTVHEKDDGYRNADFF